MNMQPTKEIDEAGTIRYFLNNRQHRTDGPAIIRACGSQFWYLNCERHREDGPAIIYPDGSHYRCLNDEGYTFNDYCKKLKQLNIPDEDIVFLKLKYVSISKGT